VPPSRRWCIKDGWPAHLSPEKFGRCSDWEELIGAFEFDNSDGGR